MNGACLSKIGRDETHILHTIPDKEVLEGISSVLISKI